MHEWVVLEIKEVGGLLLVEAHRVPGADAYWGDGGEYWDGVEIFNSVTGLEIFVYDPVSGFLWSFWEYDLLIFCPDVTDMETLLDLGGNVG